LPLYEYKCAQCGNIFEIIQKFSDQPLTVHEGCGGSVERLISASAFHLKGSGWYATDYASKGKNGGDKAKSGSPESGKDAAKGEGSKSESSSGDSPKTEASKSDTPASTGASEKKSGSKAETKS
jgi:putative FmdB family regulatory protein